mmetsp:Transcript_42136/g.78836  ORF Transcript_42136/g.78836 Transcript_42136/m.78836 type:complete len:936 (-) Transcript_42136:15-2822(-)
MAPRFQEESRSPMSSWLPLGRLGSFLENPRSRDKLRAAEKEEEPEEEHDLSHNKLHLLLNLLEMHGMTETCECLKVEVTHTHGGGEKVEEVIPLEKLITPDVQDVTQRALKEAAQGNSEHANGLSDIKQEFDKQRQVMAKAQSLMQKLQEQANTGQKMTLEEQEAKIEECDAEIEQLEATIMQMQSLEHSMRTELDQVVQETGSLQRTLEECVDAETKAKMQLARAQEEMERLMQEINAPPVQTPARVIQGILKSWSDPLSPIWAMIQEIFLAVDTDKDGHLQWNNDEIRGFVRTLFARNAVQIPSWQDHVWYEMYRRADVNASYSLEMEEASRFARHCFEAALALVLVPELSTSRDSFSGVEHWVRNYSGVSMAQRTITYPSGVNVDLVEFARTWHTLVLRNQPQRVRMVRCLESGDHLRQALQTYRECDKDHNNRLTWNNGEIRNFISASFHHFGLVPPPEESIYQMYQKFDRDRNYALDARECLELVDALFRICFVVDAQGNPAKATSRSGSRTVLQNRVLSNSARGGIGMSIKGSVLARPSVPTVVQVAQGATVRPDSPVRMVPVVRAVSPTQRNVSPPGRLSATVPSLPLVQEMVDPQVLALGGSLGAVAGATAPGGIAALAPSLSASAATVFSSPTGLSFGSVSPTRARPASPTIVVAGRPTSPLNDDNVARQISTVGPLISAPSLTGRSMSRSLSPHRLNSAPISQAVPAAPPTRARSSSPVGKAAMNIPAWALPIVQESSTALSPRPGDADSLMWSQQSALIRPPTTGPSLPSSPRQTYGLVSAAGHYTPSRPPTTATTTAGSSPLVTRRSFGVAPASGTQSPISPVTSSAVSAQARRTDVMPMKTIQTSRPVSPTLPLRQPMVTSLPGSAAITGSSTPASAGLPSAVPMIPIPININVPASLPGSRGSSVKVHSKTGPFSPPHPGR